MQDIVKSIRSSRGTYNLPNKSKTKAYFDCKKIELKDKIDKFSEIIGTLAYSIVHLEDPPSGCAIIPMKKFQIHLLLKVTKIFFFLFIFLIIIIFCFIGFDRSYQGVGKIKKKKRKVARDHEKIETIHVIAGLRY